MLLLPAGSDIRDYSTSSGDDFAECPSGSGRLYRVKYVDDVARGFPNEYRIAFVIKYVPWPTPNP